MLDRTRMPLLILALAWAQPAWAQDDPVELIAPEELRKTALSTVAATGGWGLAVTFGGTASFNHASNVVGADDGATLQLGFLLGGTLSYESGAHLWETPFKLQHAQTRTPQLDRFIKSIDLLDIKSTYFYTLPSVPWFGPFGQFKLNTQILSGQAVRAADVVVLRDGVPENLAAQEALDLTKPFEPLVLREAIGAFANPLKEKTFRMKLKLGVGAQEIIARDGFVVTDNKDTPELEITSLETTAEVGGVAELELAGDLVEEKLGWKIGFDFFLPFVTSSDTMLEGFELANLDVNASLSVKIVEWLSLEYVLTVVRRPLIVDEFQTTNSLLLTANFTLI